MALKNSRGQSSIELAMVVMLITTLILAIHHLAKTSRGYLPPAQLSSGGKS